MDIEAFILVGGRSSRFGRDKATLRIGKTSLVERIAATVTDAIAPRHLTLVAANDKQFSTSLAFDHGFPFVFDLHAGRGPLGGIHAAMANARSEWALIVACDFPLVSGELLKRLSRLASENYDAMVPQQMDGRLQPLCAVWRVKRCLPLVAEILQIDRPTPPVTTIFERVRTRIFRYEEYDDLAEAKHCFLNVNTPSEFQAATALASNPGI